MDENKEITQFEIEFSPRPMGDYDIAYQQWHDRLTGYLARAKLDRTEELEKENERLRRFAEKIVKWSDAYSEDIFPEVSPEMIDAVCKKLGIRIGHLAASILRKSVKPFGEMAMDALVGTEDPH